MTEERPVPVFGRIVCGVDATPESLDAVRQAVRLRPPGSEAPYLECLLYRRRDRGRLVRGADYAGLEQEAGEPLRRALALAGDDVTSRLVNGAPDPEAFPRSIIVGVDGSP